MTSNKEKGNITIYRIKIVSRWADSGIGTAIGGAVLCLAGGVAGAVGGEEFANWYLISQIWYN